MSARIRNDQPQGWPWTGNPIDAQATDAGEDIAQLFARVFRGQDGERAIAILRGMTIERRTPPDAPESALRHLEGQRALVALMEQWVARGRGAP